MPCGWARMGTSVSLLGKSRACNRTSFKANAKHFSSHSRYNFFYSLLAQSLQGKGGDTSFRTLSRIHKCTCALCALVKTLRVPLAAAEANKSRQSARRRGKQWFVHRLRERERDMTTHAIGKSGKHALVLRISNFDALKRCERKESGCAPSMAHKR